MPLSPADAKNLEELGESLAEERQRLLSLLSEKKWFRHTEFEIQKKLLTLPDDFEGFLTDFPSRNDEYGGMDVLKLLDILRGNYNAISVFQVRSQKTNQVFTYEYTASKFGRNPGYRGVIFLEVGGEIKYFILRQTDKFALGREVIETIGGYIQFKNNKLLNMPKTVEEQIIRELGLKDIIVKRFIDLGLVDVDPAVTNNATSLYAAMIDATGVDLERLKKKIFRTKPVNFELVIEPIDRLREYIHKVDESFFLACVVRLISMGILSI
jgi:hypothetical protein